MNIFIAVYFNDIIVYLKNLEEHDRYIQVVIKMLIDTRLILKIKKCKFDMTIIKYLRIIYTLNRLKIKSKKINIIL